MSMYETPWKDPKRLGLPRRTQILFANRQWAVTPDAIVEHHAPKYYGDCRYHVLRKDCPDGWLTERPAGAYSLLDHMAEKEWVDLDAFIEAWLIALKFWDVSVDPMKIAVAVDRAHKARWREGLDERPVSPTPPSEIKVFSLDELGEIEKCRATEHRAKRPTHLSPAVPPPVWHEKF